MTTTSDPATPPQAKTARITLSAPGSRLTLMAVRRPDGTKSPEVLDLSGLPNGQMRLKIKQPRDRPLKQILVIDDLTFEIREERHL